tara:strand:+ start:1429 stop:2925 length:1497 start_codon:yes stop_codon:yes gene_type:complete
MSDALMKSSELRKLVRMFNKRTKITIPKGLKGQADMVKFLSKHGKIDHEGKSFFPSVSTTGNQLKLSDYDKMFPPKTTEQKAEAKQKATTRKESSEANMVKSLQGKGYTVTKSKPSEKKPTPAPKKPAKSAPTPSGLKPTEKKMTEKEKAIFLKDLREQSLKILIDVDLKDTTEEYRTAEAFRKKRLKMKPNIKEEHEQRKIDNDKILERLKLIAGVVADKQKEAQKKPKKAPAKKAKQFNISNEQITKAQTIKKEVADKKSKDASDSGKVSDANYMKRPAFKFLLKKQTELYDTIIKLNKQRISGSLDEDKMDDMIDSLFNRINKESSLQLNTKTKKDDIVFKLGQGTKRTEELIKLKIKSKIAEANTLKKAPAKKAPEKYNIKDDPVAMKVEFLKKAVGKAEKLLSAFVNKQVKEIKKNKSKFKTLNDVQTEFKRVDKLARDFIYGLKSGSDETDTENDFTDDMISIYEEDGYMEKITNALPDKKYVSPKKKKGKK